MLTHNAGCGNNSVYRSVVDGVTNYVGITNNYAKRVAQHAADKRGFAIQEVTSGLSRLDARSVEQALIVKFGKGEGGTLVNKINSISPKRKNYAELVKRGNDILKSIGFTP